MWNKQKLKTARCFTAAAGEAASWPCMSVKFLVRQQFCKNLIVWQRLRKVDATAQQTVDQYRNEGEAELNGIYFFHEGDYNWTQTGITLQSSLNVFFNAHDLTWFLVCCCALSLLLGCRGVSLGMGPIGVGCKKKHKETLSKWSQFKGNQMKRKNYGVE